jgi:hypothetical protein
MSHNTSRCSGIRKLAYRRCRHQRRWGYICQVGFVTTLAASPQFQAITVPAEQLLSYPGAVFTAPEAIANDGTIVGVWFGADFNTHGFIATKH